MRSRWRNSRTPSCGTTNRPDPREREEAVRLARACGSDKALAYALTANVMRRVIAGAGEGLPEAEEAQAAAAPRARLLGVLARRAMDRQLYRRFGQPGGDRVLAPGA